MTLERFQMMMDFLREQTRNFCRESPVTLDEAERFVRETSWFCWCVFAVGKGNETLFRDAVERFLRDEILRVRA